MNTPDPTITAEALDRLEAMLQLAEREAARPDSGPGSALTERGKQVRAEAAQTAADLRIALALSRRALASGGGGELQPLGDISLDGLHEPTTGRRWLARQLMDSKLTEKEAYGIVAHHPSISEIIQQPPEPKPAPVLDGTGHIAIGLTGKPAPDHAELVTEARLSVAELRMVDEGLIGPGASQRGAVRDAAAVLDRLADALASAPSGEVGTKCYECSGELFGPICLACNPEFNVSPKQAAENARMREALAWYADPISYAITQSAEPRSAVHGDNGKRARAALASVDGEGK